MAFIDYYSFRILRVAACRESIPSVWLAVCVVACWHCVLAAVRMGRENRDHREKSDTQSRKPRRLFCESFLIIYSRLRKNKHRKRQSCIPSQQSRIHGRLLLPRVASLSPPTTLCSLLLCLRMTPEPIQLLREQSEAVTLLLQYAVPLLALVAS